MQLAEREFPQIFCYYHVDSLGLVFDGFELITPDKILYYFHDPKNGDLYAVELADYIHEFMESKPYMRIAEDFWPGHRCDWEVERWLTYDEAPDDSDFSKWFYWPECGDKCVMAKLKADVSALEGRELEYEIPDISEEEMAAQRARLDGLLEIDDQR